MRRDVKGVAAGAVLVAIGLLYGSMTLFTLPIGEPFDMGPGFFPAILSGILIAIGSIELGRSFFRNTEDVFGKVAWRAIFFLLLSVIAFAVLLNPLGLLPTVFITAMLATLARPNSGIWKSTLISGTIAVLCTLVFVLGIQIPIPIVGTFTWS